MPGCSQCSLSGYTCDGYATSWTFIQQGSGSFDQNPNNGKHHEQLAAPVQIKRRDNSPRLIKVIPESPVAHFTPSLQQEISFSPTIHHLLTVIVESYLPESERNPSTVAVATGHSRQHPRICGTWVEVLYELPCLAHTNSLLSKAVTALVAAVLTSVCISRQSISEPYLLAIRSLRKTLENGVGRTQELIPAVMCLILVEVCIPSLFCISLVAEALLTMKGHDPKRECRP